MKAVTYLLIAAAGCSAMQSGAILDFDSAPLYTATPFTLTVNGLSAGFSSVPSGTFLIAPTAFATLTGNVLITDGGAATLRIGFSSDIATISMNFATVAPDTLTLTAMKNGIQVGQVQAVGSVPFSFSYPEGVISFGGQTFDSVLLTSKSASFAIDNVDVTVPQPSSLVAVPSGNYTGNVSVTASNGCAWTAASDAYWLNVTSGTSGTGNGTVGFTAFSNTQTSSRGATITVKDSGGNSVGTFIVTQAGGSAPLNQRRVTMLYHSFLGREPDAPGLAFWSSQDPANLGLAFYISDEFKILSYRVVQIYRTLLNREPRYADEYLQAVSGIRIGASVPADLASKLISQLGITTTTQLASTMCANLYPYAPSGSYSTAACQNDVQTLAGQGFTGGALVVKFFDSYYATTPWQNRYAVYLMYAVTLNRPPDDPGFNYWLTTMTQNNYDNYWLVTAFVISPEFSARFN